MVGKAVEVNAREGIKRHVPRGGDGASLGAANDGPRKVQVGRASFASGQDEAAERLQVLVHRVDLTLEPVDLRLDDPQRHLAGREVFSRRGDVGAEVEQLVLNCPEHRARLLVVDVQQGDADRAIGFVDVADRVSERMFLGDPRPVREAHFATVAGPRVDLVELDQAAAPYCLEAPAITSSRTTMTMAAAWKSTRRCIHVCDCCPVTSLPDAIAITPRTRT